MWFLLVFASHFGAPTLLKHLGAIGCNLGAFMAPHGAQIVQNGSHSHPNGAHSRQNGCQICKNGAQRGTRHDPQRDQPAAPLRLVTLGRSKGTHQVPKGAKRESLFGAIWRPLQIPAGSNPLIQAIPPNPECTPSLIHLGGVWPRHQEARKKQQTDQAFFQKTQGSKRMAKNEST